MITYQESTKFWQRSWFAALIGGLAVGGGVWWWQAHQEALDASEVVSSGASAPVSTPQRPVFAAVVDGAASTPTVLADGRPSDFTPEDWAALKAAMSTQPNGQAEMERVVTYLRFQRSFEQWQALADSRDVQQRHQLAESLLNQVPDRLSKGEVTMGEALLLSTALLTDLEADEHLREQRLTQMRNKFEALSPQPDVEQAAREAERLTEFKRRQSAIVASWQAQPEGKRDQAALERDLESARRAVYGNAKQ
ncbi:MAG: hypothetical protein Q7V20_12940 [Aquabacterium sp.]|uniref:hypothetical protein n=1 Tax=Aquabacterium sp. TaxID=1872578 RepID=UPI002719385A|nr:hypothetical protein [Aquabacterium sp.]MDO9004350.1 hypothetical protein [Aquabacterium sp.]